MTGKNGWISDLFDDGYCGLKTAYSLSRLPSQSSYLFPVTSPFLFLHCFLLLEKASCCIPYMQQNAFINMLYQCTAAKVRLDSWLSPPSSLPSSGSVRRNESLPVQRQPPGPERLPAERPKLLCGGHVPVCASNSHPPLRAEVLGQDTQSLAALHSYVRAAGLWKGPQSAQQTQAEHGVLRAGEHYTTSTGNVFQLKLALFVFDGSGWSCYMINMRMFQPHV